MDFTTMQRDASAIFTCLLEQDNQLIAKKPFRIVFPARYLTGALGFIGDYISVVGIFAIVHGNSYAVSVTGSKIQFDPDTTGEITIGDTKYTELGFEPGTVVIPDLDILKENTLIYYVYDEIVAKGKNPSYFNYLDNVKLFANVNEDAGVNLSASPALLSIFAASRARVKGDLTSYFRETLRSQADLVNEEPVMIPARSVEYGATNTTAKLLGSYPTMAITAALVNQAKETENIEELLRS